MFSMHSVRKKNPAAYLLLKLFLLFLAVILLDRAIGSVLRHFYFRQVSGMAYRTTYSIDSTEAELLVFGSSRANHHYHPDVFTAGLPYTYYNVGRDGSYNLYHYAVLRSVLKRYKPRAILLEFGREEFRETPVGYERLSVLLPYYAPHPEIREIVHMRSNTERLKLTASAIYPFNSSMFSIAIGNAEINKKRRGDYMGYVALDKQWPKPLQDEAPAAAYEMDSLSVWAYESFLKDCKAAGTQVFVLCSPYFTRGTQADASMQLGKEIAARHDVPFLDFSRDAYFLERRELFSDVLHLNDEGAKQYSAMVIEKIKPLLR
jgi:hypothetical protein